MTNEPEDATEDAADAQPESLLDNAEASQWELRHGDALVGVVQYREDTDASPVRRDIMHVEVVPALRGHGVSAPFLDNVLAEERAAGRKVKPYCGYAAGHIRRRPELHDLLAD